MIQDVVEVVELTALRPTRRKRCRGLIRAVEGYAEATEQARHRQIRLPVAVVDRRVEEHRLTARAREPVAAPEIPVQERGRRAVPGEEPIHAPEQPLAGGAERSGQAAPAGELELRAQPPLAEELRPVATPGVRLRRASDGVVASPPETGLGHRVQRREPFTEPGLARLPALAGFDPLEREECRAGGSAAREKARHAQRARALELGEPGRLGLEHGKRLRGGHFHEHGARRAHPAVTLVDAPARHPLLGTSLTARSGERADLTGDGRERLHPSCPRPGALSARRQLRQALALAAEEGSEAEPVVQRRQRGQVRRAAPESAGRDA